MLNIINKLQESFIEISNLIRYGNSNILSDVIDASNQSGDFVKKLDIEANNILKNKLYKCSNIRAIGSEEDDELCYTNFPNAEYLVCFDPLDGSSNIEANITVGTIFAIYKYMNSGIQNGHNIVCAGYCLYGSSTQLIITSMEYVQMFILKNNGFELMNKNIKIKDKGNIYSINESNKRLWLNNRYNNLINMCINEKYTSRWVGSMVADAHRTLLKGGLFAYPENTNNLNGKIRLLYEAYPFAYIFKLAGGFSSNGSISILDIPFPKNIHKKTPIILCGKEEFLSKVNSSCDSNSNNNQ